MVSEIGALLNWGSVVLPQASAKDATKQRDTRRMLDSPSMLWLAEYLGGTSGDMPCPARMGRLVVPSTAANREAQRIEYPVGTSKPSNYATRGWGCRDCAEDK